MKLIKTNASASGKMDKKQTLRKLKALHNELFQLQHLFYANHSQSLLIIFQGIDASGKDGVIRSVFSCVNPLGVNAYPFKVPCDMEREHDYMWRISQKLPEKGIIQIFNRSYYEDILVPTIEKSVNYELITSRYEFINAFEKHLISEGTIVLKFYLHISRTEQKERIENRLHHPMKKWKYSEQDFVTNEKYDQYIDVYEKIIDKCNVSPWIIVPSDDKWYRNYFVAHTIVQKLKSLKLTYPALSASKNIAPLAKSTQDNKRNKKKKNEK